MTLTFLPMQQQLHFLVDFPSEEKTVPRSNRTKKAPTIETPLDFQLSPKIYINSAKQLNTFYFSDENRHLEEFVKLFLNQKNTTVPPVVIIGKSGSGKTHLLQAVANQYDQSKEKIFYMEGLRLKMLLVESTKSSEKVLGFEGWQNKYDLVLIDDLPDLVANLEVQKKLCYIFDSLVNAGKKLMISSDLPLDKLDLSQRLSTRLASCLVFTLKIPKKEKIKEMLSQMIKNTSTENDVNMSLIEHQSFSKNFDFNGHALKKIFYQVQNPEIVFGELSEQSKKVKKSFEDCLSTIAQEFNLSSDQILSKSRIPKLVQARHRLIKMLYFESSFKKSEVAKMLNLDHTSVLHVLKK